MRRRSRMTPARKLACVLLAVAVVVSVVYATGAFTSTTADRNVDVAVAGHGSAFLSLQPSEGPNGKFASYSSGGALQVSIGGAAGPSRASGVNPDSKTAFKNVFTITNNGSQPVAIWITGNSRSVTFLAKSTGVLIEGQGNSRPLSVGETLKIGFVIDTRGGGVQPGRNLLKSVTIHTNANNKVVSKARRNAKKSGSGGSSGDGSGNGASKGWPNDENRDNKNSGDGGGDDSGDSESGDSSNGGISTDPVQIAKAVGLGMTVGEAGYSTPEMSVFGHKIDEVTLKEADSPFYLLGELLATIVPGLDIITDLKATILNAAQGDVFEAVLSFLGTIPVLGSFGDAAQVVKIAKQWVDLFSGKVDEAVNLLQATLLKVLPTSTSVKLADVFTDAPLTKIAKRGDGKAMLKHIDELSSPRVTDLRKATGADWDDVWTLLKKDVDLSTAKRFDRKGIADVEDMVYYTKKGVHPRVVKRLRTGVKGHGALSTRQTKILVKYASGSGYVLGKYGKVAAYCSWQKQRGFSNGTVEQACGLITP